MAFKDHERQRAYQKAYQTTHKEQTRAACKRYRDNHPGKWNARQRAYKASHAEQIFAKHRAYLANHKDQLLAYQRAYRATHRTEIRAYDRTQYAKHPEKTIAKESRRRAQMRGALATLTADQWKAILAAYKGRCAYCGVKPKKLTMDHVIPLARQGTHIADNIVPACLSCNLRKHANPPPLIPALRLLC